LVAVCFFLPNTSHGDKQHRFVFSEIPERIRSMQTTRYVVVKVRIEHPDDIEPERIIEDMDYGMESRTDGATITDTEILASEVECLSV